MSSSNTPIPKRLRELREEVGLSQAQLGVKAGFDEFVASARMNQYETGKHTPKFQTMKHIARVLQVDPAYFYCQEDELAQLIRDYSQHTKRNRSKLRLT